MSTTRFPNVIEALNDLQRAHPEHGPEVDIAKKMILGERPNIEEKYDALLLRLDRALTRLTDLRDEKAQRKDEVPTMKAYWQHQAVEAMLNRIIGDFQWMRARNVDMIRALARQREKKEVINGKTN